MKVKVQHCIKVIVSAIGDMEFKPEFLGKVKEVLKASYTSWGATYYNSELHNKSIVIELFGTNLNKAHETKQTVVQSIVLLAEHGPDADILDELIKRYPELKTHPKFSGLKSAFENMTGVLKDILADDSNRTVAEIHRRKTEGIELTPEDLAATGTRSRGMTVEERATFREQSILGQTSDHKRGKEHTPPVIPEIYKKLMDKAAAEAGEQSTKPVSNTPKEYGPPLPGDEANVFTRSAKK